MNIKLKNEKKCIGCPYLHLELKGEDIDSECSKCLEGYCGGEDRRYCDPYLYKTDNPKKNKWVCLKYKKDLRTCEKPGRLEICLKENK